MPFAYLTVLFTIADPLFGNALTVVASELLIGALFSVAALFVTPVATIVVKVTPPVVRDALFVVASELVALALILGAVGFVRFVGAIRLSIADPSLGNALLTGLTSELVGCA